MKKACIFCSKPAETKEHIIPRWLQKHFDLENQRLGLWNNTTIFYKQAIIPACKVCNSENFSLIEKKVREGTATKQEYYIWALKIRYCLSIKDTTLLWDRKNADSGPLLKKSLAEIGSDFITEVFANVGKKYFYRPYPFGSVFLLSNPVNDGGFGLVDIPHPYWAMTIALPENKFLSVFFTDRGLVKKDIAKTFKKKGGLKYFFRVQPDELSAGIDTKCYFKKITYQLLFRQYSLANIPYGYKVRENGIQSYRVPQKIRYRKRFKKNVLQDMSNLCGLGDSYGQNSYDQLPLPLKG